MDKKMTCTIKGVQVSKQKHQEHSGAEGLHPWQKIQVEVELEVELDGSGNDGWRA